MSAVYVFLTYSIILPVLTEICDINRALIWTAINELNSRGRGLHTLTKLTSRTASCKWWKVCTSSEIRLWSNHNSVIASLTQQPFTSLWQLPNLRIILGSLLMIWFDWISLLHFHSWQSNHAYIHMSAMIDRLIECDVDSGNYMVVHFTLASAVIESLYIWISYHEYNG